jgi:hypothetical protein
MARLLSRSSTGYRSTANRYGEMAKQAEKRVQLAKSTRLRKANPKAVTPIDPERLSQAIQYLKEHLKR